WPRARNQPRGSRPDAAPARPLLIHALEELLVRLGPAHLVGEEFHRVDDVQRVEERAEEPDALEDPLREEQLLLAGRALVDVEAREDALLHELAIEVDLAVARALELLEDDLVHARAGVNERRGDDGQRAALLD